MLLTTLTVVCVRVRLVCYLNSGNWLYLRTLYAQSSNYIFLCFSKYCSRVRISYVLYDHLKGLSEPSDHMLHFRAFLLHLRQKDDSSQIIYSPSAMLFQEHIPLTTIKLII